jgi:DNA-binding XRE family transcriptional regulator
MEVILTILPAPLALCLVVDCIAIVYHRSGQLSRYPIRREASLTRGRRLGLEAAMRQAADRVPLDEVLRNFCSGGLTDDAGDDRLAPMPNKTATLRERRDALGISRERLAREADISSASIEQFEAGARPVQSVAMEKLEATLDRLEREAA